MQNLQNKELKIYESIRDFFSRAIQLKDTELLTKYFKFFTKVPNHAPFNNTLVFIQNPNCGYYATARQWLNRFNRTIKPDSRPMVIMFPFGPVEFVYDLDDTEGDEITDEKILYWWKENGGKLDETIIENTLSYLDKVGIGVKIAEARKYFEENGFNTRGVARRFLSNGNFDIVLHPGCTKSDIEKYGVLCHEMAHIFLGHLGEVKVSKNERGKIVYQKIASDRSHISNEIMEIEAELVAWMVFNSFGFEKNSESYVASWLVDQGNIENLGMGEVLKVAGKIQDVGRGKIKK